MIRRIGLGFPGQPYGLRDVINAAQLAEASDFESVWIAEDLWTGRDALSVLSCLALSTKRIQVCTGLINPYIRHPVLIAMTLNTLSELAPGRLVLGIGAGMPWKPLVAGQMGRWPPLQAIRESVRIGRDLLAGETIEFGDEAVNLTVSRPCFDGSVGPFSNGVRVYLGAVGPRMTQLAGEIGDGLLLGTGTRPGEMAPRLDQVAAGAQRASRDPKSIDVAALIITSASRDGKIHPNALGYAAKSVAALNESEIAAAGFEPERVRQVQQEYRQGNCQSAYRLLSPEMISAFVAAGTPDDCLNVIERFVEAGVKLPILMPFGGDVNEIMEVGRQYLRS